jgi:hypothetical protein
MVLMAGFTGPVDLVSVIDAQHYFKSRQIAMKPEKLLELAAKSPTGAKEEIAQLLAIRWLGAHPAAVKKIENAREILRQIADGTKGKDKLGFASDYARLALARVDGKPAVLANLPADSVRTEALKWFPKGSTIFGSMDLRPPKGVMAEPSDVYRRLLAKEMPERAKAETYDFAEKAGNLRIDRASFAIIPGKDSDEETRLYFRFTGKGRPQGLADFFAQLGSGGGQVKKQKGPGGEAIIRIDIPRGSGPGLALIGDTDLLMCGFADKRGQPNNTVVVDEVLHVMAGKQASVLKGPYANTLKSTSSGVSGLAIGDLPERWSKELTGRGSPFRAFPQHFHVKMTRNAKGTKIGFTGSAANAKDAKAFVDSVQTLKQQAIEGLDKLPEFAKSKIDKKTIKALQAALKSIKVESRDALLTGSATISYAAAKAGMEMIPWLFLTRRAARPIGVPSKRMPRSQESNLTSRDRRNEP